MAALVRAQKGSLHCGHLTYSGRSSRVADHNRAISCALSALEHRRPFIIIFTAQGVDERISNAIVGDSQGNVVELVYAIGMVNPANTLLKRPCDKPIRLHVDPPTAYRIPRLHCAPWPPADWGKGHILW